MIVKPFNLNNPIDATNLKRGQSVLHGDVIVERVENVPKEFESMNKEPNDVLAYGESTFHLHKLFRAQDPDLMVSVSFDLRTDDTGNKWLRVIEPVMLRHQEHRQITLPKGLYKIGIQREYDPFTKLARKVQD